MSLFSLLLTSPLEKMLEYPDSPTSVWLAISVCKLLSDAFLLPSSALARAVSRLGIKVVASSEMIAMTIKHHLRAYRQK
jgi:hypothetical protein